MLNILLFGPPGAGKGTQADLLKEKYNLIHLSTGEVIRQEVQCGSELGRMAEAQMQGGGLASDKLVLSIIDNFVNSHTDAHGVIYDGFPRTLPQAKEFNKMLCLNPDAITIMLSLEIPDNEIIKRITERAKVSGRADDQNPETIQKRIDVYNERTAVVAEYYNSLGLYRSLDGLGTIDEVFDRLCNIIDTIKED